MERATSGPTRIFFPLSLCILFGRQNMSVVLGFYLAGVLLLSRVVFLCVCQVFK